MEEKDVFCRAIGTETDIVQKEMYEFEDRSGTRVALRPEGTAGVVRAYLENELDKKNGLEKFYYMGPMFRSERPQAGRLRQFHQIGVEELGTNSPYADAEAIHALTTFLDAVGAHGYKVKLNNLGTFDERKIFRGELLEFFKPHAKELCEDCKRRMEKNVFRLLDCKVETCRKIARQSPPLKKFLTAESTAHYEKVCRALDALKISYIQDDFMVRGLDYYTLTVFEVTHPKLGAQDALGAGGRYDNLIESFGGPKLGAVGFAVGVERLQMCLEKQNDAAPVRKNSVFLAALGEKAFQVAFGLLGELRSHKIAAFMDLDGKSLKSQMRSADKSGSRYMIILGDNEIEKGVAVLKDLNDGSQQELKFTEVTEIIRKLNG